NVLAQNYLEQALRIGHEWPMLGVWGSGAIIPEFEVDPPEHLREFLDLLALQRTSRPRWSNVIPCIGARPWGAGLCVRSTVASAYQRYSETTTVQVKGRTGQVLNSGEDVEIGYVACDLGFGVGIFPELALVHLIPKERLNEDYLVRLAEGTAASAAI